MNLIDYIDSDEGRDCTAVPECFNCHQKSGITEMFTADGREVFACDDCGDEQRRIEKQADELAKLPSCAVRNNIIDNAPTTQQLVNQLRAHDQAACSACAYSALGRVA
jgi:hypothetical protein